MNISETIIALDILREKYGDLKVFCMTDDGPSGLCEKHPLTTERIEITYPDGGCPVCHVTIGGFVV